MAFPLVPLITAGANLIGQFLGGAQNKKAFERNRGAQMQMYNMQRQDALSDWQKQNEYNSPKAQMARFRDAGLNPNLVYGQMSDANASMPRSVAAEAAKYEPYHPDLSGFGSSLLSYMDIKMKEAQVDNLEASNTAILQDALLKAAQVQSTTADVHTKEFDLMMKNTLKDISLQAAQAALDKTKADTAVQLTANEIAQANKASTLEQAAQTVLNMRLQGKQLQESINNLKKDAKLKQLDIELKEKGIMPGDPMWARILARLLEKYVEGGVRIPGPMGMDLNPKSPASPWSLFKFKMGMKP